MSKTDLSLLVVEDEPDTRYLLTQIFTMRGFTVRSAEDGFAALGMIRSAIPDILLSDLNMPGMSGFELLSVVRRLYPQIHVIATSGAYSGKTVPKGIAADSFHEKASGLASLFELMDMAALLGHTSFFSHRTPTPLWIDLESRKASESHHVLLNCPACLRPFRQTIDEINAEIRETNCSFCGGKVDYAIALAVKPKIVTTEPRSIAAESRASASDEYSTQSRNARRA
ncbi:MAG TPA: response regulator [Acidobacteriaceae bacterium]|nr:response regulator [Acidobacteriaceae bacterium]